MAEIKGIDVSGYNTNGKDLNGNPIPIDWKQVKQSGIEFAIPKIIRKDLTADKQFENNWYNSIENGVAIGGVYNYSYATTVDKARIDADAVINTLNTRKTTVWLDVEDDVQKNLGIELIHIINAYQNAIKSAGLTFGVYTGLSFYNSYIKPYEKYFDCNFWIAKYGRNNGLMPSVKPKINKPMVGWQYSSEAIIPGIVGFCDVNVFYSGIETNQKQDPIYPTLRNGDRNAYVLAWQIFLNLQGYNCGKEDGWFGLKTESAVKLFQSNNKLNPNGIIDMKTWSKVNP
jgi:GH25 family lysozyme M1 (1,4-beta-N-acetylmuramidase)